MCVRITFQPKNGTNRDSANFVSAWSVEVTTNGRTWPVNQRQFRELHMPTTIAGYMYGEYKLRVILISESKRWPHQRSERYETRELLFTRRVPAKRKTNRISVRVDTTSVARCGFEVRLRSPQQEGHNECRGFQAPRTTKRVSHDHASISRYTPYGIPCYRTTPYSHTRYRIPYQITMLSYAR